MMNDFDLRLATSRRFFEIFANKTQLSNVHRVFGEFLLEIALFEADQIRSSDDSMLAMAALLIAAYRPSIKPNRVTDRVPNTCV